MNIILSIIFIVLSSSLSYAAVQEFCVADTSTEGPGGFKCKNSKSVATKDFVFLGPGTPVVNPIFPKYSVTYITVDQLPGLNGLGISMAIYNFEANGTSPMHSHAKSTELIIVNSGSFEVGFISSDSTVHSSKLNVGDVIVIPQGLLHYVINPGESPASLYATYTNEMFDIQPVDSGLFGNGMPTNTVEKVTLLDAEQIKKLKNVFGGKN